ncbi:unnamed protein product [Diatraea saccharalis]|uniref:C2H2-type domain-containing protein n=1 Tax=Diatraea saccharalis TaxID=40085 RepID=A0A9N9WFD2_9NEOP|nr:unnamed protein product [Diatraea saccharalis]
MPIRPIQTTAPSNDFKTPNRPIKITSVRESPSSILKDMTKKQLGRESAIAIIVNTNVCPFRFNRRFFSCIYCKIETLTMLELINHTSNEHYNVDPYGVRSAIKSLGKIQPVKLNIIDYVCRLCNQELANFEDLKNHLVGKHKKFINLENDGVIPYNITENSFTCGRCNEKFDEYRQLNKHMDEHVSKFICDQCGNGYPTEGRLKMHTYSHKEGSFPCDVCGKVYRSKLGKRHHYQTVHLNVKKNKCTLCPATFRDYYQKQRHLVAAHGLQRPVYTCGFCPKTFLTTSHVRAHERLAHTEAAHKYSCDHCSYHCNNKNALAMHMISHSDEKNYKCQVCNKSYARKKTLTEHMKIHNNDRRFACQYCDKAFIQKCSLKGSATVHPCMPIRPIRITAPCDDSRTRIRPIKIIGVRESPSNIINDLNKRQLGRESAIAIIVNANVYPFRFNRFFMCLYCKHQTLTIVELMQHTINEHYNVDQYKVRNAIKSIGKIQPIKVNIIDYVCKLCNQELSNFEDLKNHLVGKHKMFINLENDGVVPYKITENSFICGRCNEKCESYRQLNRHMNQHYRNFICDQCGSGFPSEGRLKIHSVSHENGSFPCEICDKVYRTIHAKQDHIKIVHLHAKKNRCTLCPETFRDYYQKQKHLVEVHGLQRNVYKCGFCPKTFLTSSNVRAHERLAHVKMHKYSCDHCSYHCYDKYALTMHMICHSDEKNYKCQVCKKSYARKKTLTEHMRIHNNDRRFACQYCDRAFVQKCSLKGEDSNPIKSNGEVEQSHEKKSTNIQLTREQMMTNDELRARKTNAQTLLENTKICPFKWMKNLFMCFFCEQRFADPAKLRDHHTTEHMSLTTEQIKKAVFGLKKYELVKVDITDVSCKYCDDVIPDLTSLKYHLLFKHNKSVDPKSSDGILPFKLTSHDLTCTICDSTYAEYKTLNHHMNTHFKNFVCEKCGAGFVTPNRLRTHAVVHETGSFPCDACDKIFKSSTSKSEHYATVHKKVKRHRCPHCNESFHNYFQRNKHISNVHGLNLQEFKCTMCPKVFIVRANLSVHIQTVHLKVKRFSCNVCEWRCYLKSELKDHMLRHGGDDSNTTESNREVEQNHNQKTTKMKLNSKQTMTLNDELKARKKNAQTLLENSKLCPFKWLKNLYMCFYCEQQFPDPAILRDHHRTEHRSQTSEQIKEAVFRLKKYELVKVDITDVSCKLCDDVIPDFASLKNHLLIKHKKGIDPKSNDGMLPFKLTSNLFKCTICDITYAEYKTLNHHMNIHFQNFICEQCGAGFVTPDRLRTHAFSHETGSFPCNGCDKIFKSANAKNEHFATVHMKVKRHRCPHCPETFRNYFQRNKHISNVHGVKLKEFKCTLCPKVFISSGKLGVHIRTVHLKLKRYSCDVCEWRFYSKSELKDHMVRHGGERKHQCNICKKGYARKYTLTEHMRIHENDRRFVCPTCGKSFIQNSTLKHHIKIHHPPPVGPLKISDVLYDSTNS